MELARELNGHERRRHRTRRRGRERGGAGDGEVSGEERVEGKREGASQQCAREGSKGGATNKSRQEDAGRRRHREREGREHEELHHAVAAMCGPIGGEGCRHVAVERGELERTARTV